MLTLDDYSKLNMITRLADGRGLASFHCIFGLPRGRTDTELDRSGQPRLQTQALARYAAVLCGPTRVHLRQHTRWYEAPPDRNRLACCVYSQLLRNYRPSGVLGPPRERARRFRDFCQWWWLEHSRPVIFRRPLWQCFCVPW